MSARSGRAKAPAWVVLWIGVVAGMVVDPGTVWGQTAGTAPAVSPPQPVSKRLLVSDRGVTRPEDVAGNGAGTFSVSWRVVHATDDFFYYDEPFTRTFDSDGTAGPVNSLAARGFPSGAGAAADGSYVIAWTLTGGLFTPPSLYAKWSSDGADGEAISVAPSSFGHAIAPQEDGGFLALFEHRDELRVRRVDPAGTIAEFDAVAVFDAHVVLRGEARFCSRPEGAVVAWTHDTPTPEEGPGPVGVYARRVDGAGAGEGDIIQVNAPLGSTLDTPALACLPDGGFVVGWEVAHLPFEGNGITDLWMRRYDSSGSPAGQPMRINRRPSGERQTGLTFLVEPSGLLLATWVADNDVKASIRGRRFTRSLQPRGKEFVLEAGSAFSFSMPGLALAGNDRLVVVWNSPDGILARIFAR